MITPSDLEKLTDVSTIDRIYDELMAQGIDSFRTIEKSLQSKIFSKICYRLIQQYVKWNDYVHSNNIMQLYKDTVFVSEQVIKPSWFIRYEIIIYGRRTPLYFIDHPHALFDRINTINSRANEAQTMKLTHAVVSLCNYYCSNFLSPKTLNDDKNLFISHINEHFAKTYALIDKKAIQEEAKKAISDIVDYAKNPVAFIMPGVSADDIELWDEEDAEEESKTKQDNIQEIVDIENKPDNELKNLDGKTIKFMGDIKNSLVSYIRWLSKTYGFTADIVSDYEKLTNTNLKTLRYSDKISAIIVGPMPHSIKGMNGYSSGLEMMRAEPGYPPIFECIVNEKLKITKTSIIKALQEANNTLMSL